MKRISVFGLFLTLLLGLGFDASALRVTFEWDIPGSVKIQLGSSVGEFVELAPDQTSYVLETTGWCYIYGTDGYMVTGGQSVNGSDSLDTGRNANGIWAGLYFGSSRDGQSYKISVEKIERNDSFNVDVVNGAEYINAKFSSGYVLDLTDGNHPYNFNPEIDGKMTITLSDVASAYKVTLNGVEITKNNFYPKYEDIDIQPNDNLLIQVFEDEEPADYTFTLEYGENMEGCLLNIYNRTTGQFIYPSDIVDNSIVVKDQTNLRVNFVGDDYTFTSLLLNGEEILPTFSNNSVLVTVTEDMVLKIEGKAKEYANINFTGYIINADGVDFSLSYQGAPFAIPEGEAVTSDIVVDDTLTMPASETMKYVIPISEKNGKFFFAPKKGYYITSLFTRTPEGTVEQHSGNSSISANIDGTTFYMIVDKLPEEYSAKMNITGSDFYLKISANSTLADIWGNPNNPSYSSAVGEREISFIPGYGTPIVFGFVGDETKQPAVYLDGGEVSGIVNSESGAIEYFVTPYSPENNDALEAGLQSTIAVYNSFNERPQMSGASLQLEEGAEAEFYYSPVMHEANPAGQVVISGTQFTVKPTSPKSAVYFKNELVELDDNGEFVFNATGNARNNVVKVIVADYILSPADGTTVDNLSEIHVTFPGAKKVDYTEIPITLVGPQTDASSMDVHGSGIQWSVNFRNPSTEGNYTVTFPAGAFTIDGEESEEIKATYTFETGWTLLPAPSSTVENIDEIVLAFPKAKTVEFVGDTYSFVLANFGASYIAPGLNCKKDETATVPTFILSLPKGAKAPVGNYTFTIEEGTFMVDGKPSAEINVRYIVERESSTEYTQSPEKTIIYADYGFDFAFIFDEATTVNGPIDSSKIKVMFDDKELAAETDYLMSAEANMLMFMVTNPEYIKEGTLKVEIEAGAFKLGTTPSAAITGEWNVVAPKTFEVTVTTKGTPDENGKVNDLSEITLIFPDAMTGEVFIESGAQLRSSDYSYSQVGKIVGYDNLGGGVKFTITFNPAPQTNGKYSLYVHPGTMTLDGAHPSPMIEESFLFDKSSGIASAFADENGNVTVFTLDGKKVLDNVPAAGLHELENGIYIINGKKVVVK